LRGQIEKLVKKESFDTFYLTTGRSLIHYNNAAQTKETEKLLSRHSEDTILACIDDRDKIKGDKVILKTQYGQTQPLSIKFVKTIKTKTLFATFHHATSNINFIFGDESDINTKTARFKSLEVSVISI